MDFNRTNIITLKFKIKSIDDDIIIDDKIYTYTGVFRYMYKTIDENVDVEYENNIKNRFNINQVEFRSLLSLVKVKRNQEITQKSKILNRIYSLENEIKLLNDKDILTKKDRYKIFKINEKIIYLKKSYNRNIVFGGLNILQEYTRSCNKNNRDINKLNLFRENRKQNIYVLGESNQKGNRFFSFDFNKLEVIYKPSSKCRTKIYLNNYKSKIDLSILQDLIDNKSISITVSFNKTYFNISFDLNSYSGLSNKIKKCKLKSKEECKSIKDKDVIKSIYNKNYKELEDIISFDKIKNRYCSIDLNPDYIGVCIFDSIDNKMKIIDKFCIDLSMNNINPKLKSDDLLNLKYNRKRKSEILYSLSRLFDIIRHYKCFNFTMEELNFTDIDNKRITNRKINNLWNRDLVINKIKKETSLMMMNLIEVNPIYTSFIGNIKYKEFDPISTSIEIGRRGSLKYNKGGLYPEININDLHTVVEICSLDVEDLSNVNWKSLYNYAYKFRWRRPLDKFNYLKIRIGNRKSKSFKLIQFNII